MALTSALTISFFSCDKTELIQPVPDIFLLRSGQQNRRRHGRPQQPFARETFAQESNQVIQDLPLERQIDELAIAVICPLIVVNVTFPYENQRIFLQQLPFAVNDMHNTPFRIRNNS